MSSENRPVRSSDGRPIRLGTYPELTWPAVIVGWFLGTLITVSIAYASLMLGFGIEGSELAAIMGWGILRGILRRNSIIENNINQTIASAVNGASAGMMFSIPALFILASSDEYGIENAELLTQFNPALMVMACIAGGIMGLAFVIPLRKQMIDFDRLAYPGGIAVATILRSPGAGTKKAMILLAGAGVSAVGYLIALRITGSDDPNWHLGKQIGLPAYLNVAFFLSLMTIGVGYLSGKGGFWFGVGGFICYWFLAPILGGIGSEEVSSLLENPNELKNALFRPTGIGMLIGAALGGLVAAFPLIMSAVRSLHDASKARDGQATESDELPAKLLYCGIGLSGIALAICCWWSVDNLSLPRAALMTVLGTMWVWIAGVIVSECVGRTNWNPLSGMTLIAVTILLVVSTGAVSTVPAIISAVLLGAAICVAISQAGDMMLDLKSGYLVGAHPKRQQLAQVIGAWLGPIVVIGLVYVLHQQYGLGSEKLPAPQGKALASMVSGIVGDNAPTYRYVAGAGLGGVLSFSGLGGIGVLIGLGFYMPFSIVLTYTIGNLLRMASDKYLGKPFGHEIGVPFAAGLIVGEALIGVGLALWKVGSASFGG